MSQVNRQAISKKAIIRRLRDAKLGQINDVRQKRGRRYEFETLINTLALGTVAALPSLRKVEALSANLAWSARRQLKIPRRISDTKLRDLLLSLTPDDIREALYRQVKAEYRRGALVPDVLPFGVAAIDGKHLAKLDRWDHPGVQKVQPQDGKPYGLARVHRAFLISSKGVVCIDSRQVCGKSNEVGEAPSFTEEILSAYKRTNLFEVIMTDAGNASKKHADKIHDNDKRYIFALKENQGNLYEDACYLLGNQNAEKAFTETLRERGAQITYRLFRAEPSGYHSWTHARQFIRIERTVFYPGEDPVVGNRYYITDIPQKRLSDTQWLYLIRNYWRIENNGNWTADAIWREDRRRIQWVKVPEAMYALSVLRMIGQNIIAVLRSMTKREWDRKSQPPWRDMIFDAYAVLRSYAEGNDQPAFV